jgi:hypothetical protein
LPECCTIGFTSLDSPFKLTPAESMMGFFLLQQYPAQPAEWSRSFYQPLLDTGKDYFTQTFKHDLLGQERFQKIMTSQCIGEQCSILLQGWEERGIA